MIQSNVLSQPRIEAEKSFYFNDGVIEAKPVHSGEWLYIRWSFPAESIRKDQRRQFIKSALQMEDKCKELGFRGWLTSSEKTHPIMNSWLVRRRGAKIYDSDEKDIFFMKEVI